MSLRPAVIEIVVSDMAATLTFFGHLGLDVPDQTDSPHVELDFSGVRLALDTEDTIRSFDSSWKPPSGGHRVALGFDCGSPAGVDSTWSELVAKGYDGHLEPWDAVWGQRYAVINGPDEVTVDLFAASD